MGRTKSIEPSFNFTGPVLIKNIWFCILWPMGETRALSFQLEEPVFLPLSLSTYTVYWGGFQAINALVHFFSLSSCFFYVYYWWTRIYVLPLFSDYDSPRGLTELHHIVCLTADFLICVTLNKKKYRSRVILLTFKAVS